MQTGSSDNFDDLGTKPISQYALENLLPNTIFSTPAVGIRDEDPLTGAACLLPQHLESFTDSLIVTHDEKPVGIIGGVEILKGVLETPSFEFFDKTKIKDVMNTSKMIITNVKITLLELLEKWRTTRRAFAIIPNQYHGFSAISVRKLLEIASHCKTDITVSSLPKKPIIMFQKNDTVRKIITTMFDNATRKLMLSGTSYFLSDRMIIQKISREMNCLCNESNFLEMRADIFKFDEAMSVPSDTNLSKAARLMMEMKSPYLVTKDNAITPWDIAMTLASDKIKNYQTGIT